MIKTKKKTKISDASLRVEFLHSAASLMNSIACAAAADKGESNVQSDGQTSSIIESQNICKLSSEAPNKTDSENIIALLDIAAFLNGVKMRVGQKVNFRVERAMKRTTCKRCSAFLSFPSTADCHWQNFSRFRKQQASFLSVSCHRCGFTKRYQRDAAEALKSLITDLSDADAHSELQSINAEHGAENGSNSKISVQESAHQEGVSHEMGRKGIS